MHADTGDRALAIGIFGVGRAMASKGLQHGGDIDGALGGPEDFPACRLPFC